MRILSEEVQRQVQHMAVYHAHQAELLDHRNEDARGHDLPLLVAHAQQALIEYSFVIVRVYHWLERELQTVIAQRLLHLVADDEILAMHFALAHRHLIGDEAVAAQHLGLLQRRLAFGHHIDGGGREFAEQHAPDGDGDMGLRIASLYRLLAHAEKDAFGRPRHLPFRALAQDHAETVAADAADDVAGA